MVGILGDKIYSRSPSSFALALGLGILKKYPQHRERTAAGHLQRYQNSIRKGFELFQYQRNSRTIAEIYRLHVPVSALFLQSNFRRISRSKKSKDE